MLKKIFISLFVLFCVGCEKEGTYVPSQDAKAHFKIEFLFEQDGVKIYRFKDKGSTRYFATGNGKMTDSVVEYRSGNNCSVSVNETVVQ